LSEEEAVDVFAEQIEGLREGGADVAWIETMSAPEEMRAAALAAGNGGMPCTITASFDTAGRTMMGLAPGAFGDLVEAFDPAPVACGANCGVGASDLLAGIFSMKPGAPLIANANAARPDLAAIVAALGPLVAPPAAETVAGRPRRRERT
jgi:methionine synthase I (cobalamin-dependent)